MYIFLTYENIYLLGNKYITTRYTYFAYEKNRHTFMYVVDITTSEWTSDTIASMQHHLLNHV